MNNKKNVGIFIDVMILFCNFLKDFSSILVSPFKPQSMAFTKRPID